MGLWSIRIKRIVILGQMKVESNGVLANNPLEGTGNEERPQRKQDFAAVTGVISTRCSRCFQTTKVQLFPTAHLQVDLTARAHRNQRRQSTINSATLDGTNICQIFLLKLLFLWESSIWPQTTHLIEKSFNNSINFHRCAFQQAGTRKQALHVECSQTAEGGCGHWVLEEVRGPWPLFPWALLRDSIRPCD